MRIQAAAVVRSLILPALACISASICAVPACGGATSSSPADGTAEGYRLQSNADGTATGNGTTCSYGGIQTAVGASFGAPDGCNDCKCTTEGAACTERVCPARPGASCTQDGGKTYASGERWTQPGTCPGVQASCECANGSTTCAEPTIGCVLDAGAAGVCKDYADRPRKPGESWFDGCNDCRCAEDGSVGCTKKACQCPPDGTVINCMPVVPEDRAYQCTGPYADYVRRSCPNVKFVY